MKPSIAPPNAMRRIRVFLIATFIVAVTPRLSADIILVSRLSDAEAGYSGSAQSQTNFLPANLSSSRKVPLQPGQEVVIAMKAAP